MAERNDIEIAVLNQISHAIVHELNVSELLNNILNILRKEMGLIRGTITLKHDDTLVIEAGAKAADGTMCRLEDDVFTFCQSGLPSPSELEKKVRSLAERVVAVSKAPQVDEYSGPVIISEDVAAALLNRILGRRLESKRRDSELDDFYKFKG